MAMARPSHTTTSLSLVVVALVFHWCQFLFETVLEFRQRTAIRKPSPPAALRSIFDETWYKASQSYALDRWTYRLIHSVYSTFETHLVISYELLPRVWNACATWAAVSTYAVTPTAKEVLASIAFVFLLTLVSVVKDAPWGAYATFVIEAKHGFNKQTVRLWLMDKVKGLGIACVLVPPIIAAVVASIRVFASSAYAVTLLWAVIMAFQLLMVFLYPNFIAPLFNKYDPIPEDSPLRADIVRLAEKVSYPLQKLYVVDGSKRSAHANAYLYGFGKNKRIVLYDTLIKGFAELNEEDEAAKDQDESRNNEHVCSVLAHELGHWNHSHVIKLMVMSSALLFAQLQGYGLIRDSSVLFEAFGYHDHAALPPKPVLIGLLLYQLFSVPVDAFLGFLSNLVSRAFEYQADQFARTLGYAKELAQSLLVLQQSEKGSLWMDSWYGAYHSSHPEIAQRIDALGVVADSDKDFVQKLKRREVARRSGEDKKSA